MSCLSDTIKIAYLALIHIIISSRIDYCNPIYMCLLHFGLFFSQPYQEWVLISSFCNLIKIRYLFPSAHILISSGIDYCNAIYTCLLRHNGQIESHFEIRCHFIII